MDYSNRNTDSEITESGDREDKIFGIDLGTTFCEIAIFQNNTLTSLENFQCSTHTPSIVKYEIKGGELCPGSIMEDSHDCEEEHNEFIIRDAKRLIGRT